ncbi:hypothetical protein BJF79_17275 [Actinomadura sp. CNU-125]|uniref:hypothetical protein n=1 Tax=Actinomadura sp. CNU-125 TaxID=1904961 RepID=UPI00095C58F2|nr:hypothetical protein [Actinomadura sp. CNU-125]OLT18500.1 hypothetical protein BJF79_17275 [Actinomadura sp. CNU-125]
MPIESPDDVAVLVELLERSADARGLGDHFAFLAGTRPEWFRPHQESVIASMLDRFEVGFGDLCSLLAGAPDRCVDLVVRRLRERRSFRDVWALAAIGTGAALAAVARHDVRRGADRREYEDLGVWVPADGPARYRFSPQRRVVLLRDEGVDHPVGLSIEEIACDPVMSPISWHYMSLRVAEVPGVPAWTAERVHLVGTRASCMWTLYANVDDRGCYRDEVVVFDEPPGPEDEIYRAFEQPGRGVGAVELKPYDADLVYSNGHVQGTPGVVGVAGGPPLGVYANPSCRSCGRLMFHVTTVENHVREYGDGWRSLFICEDCRTVACNATGWN